MKADALLVNFCTGVEKFVWKAIFDLQYASSLSLPFPYSVVCSMSWLVCIFCDIDHFTFALLCFVA